ncbi:MAG: extracellular solute-binding protein [Candidatus Hydrogenedentes bacterium]|nr:extracellular solute-binding protein [Candidatus Hydrogenedentota bacterium]
MAHRSGRGVLSAAALLLACLAAGAAEPVVLQYWGNETDLLSIDPVLDFEAMHNGEGGRPHIRVVMGQSASINRTEDPQRLLCAVAGGDPPDVVWFDRFAVSEWAARGAFLPLQEFLERDLRERPDDPWTLRPETFFEPCWNESIYRDTLYAVPSDTDIRALYYNLDVLEKYADELIAVGCVDPNDPAKVGPPTTWEQLRDATRIMSAYDNAGKLRQVGFIPNYGNSWLCIYGWLNGGDYLTPDGRTCTMNEPRVVGALAYMTELYDLMGGAEGVTAFQSALQTGDLDPFISGKVAMKIDGDWFLPGIAVARRGLRFGVAPPPAPEGLPRFGWCGGYAYVIPRGAKHPEEAWTFIKYLVSRRAYEIRNDAEAQAVRARGSVFVPRMSSRKDITEWAMDRYLYSDPTVEETYKQAMRTFVGILPISKYRSVTPVGQLMWNEQLRAMENGIYKRYDRRDIHRNAQLALDAGTRVVQNDLDRLFAGRTEPEIHWWPVVAAYLLLVAGFLAAMAFWFQRRVTAKGYFRREYYAGYLFSLPWFMGFVIFAGGPLLFSLIMSFCDYDVLSPPRFVGLRNYQEMFFNDPLFYKSLWNTLYMALGIPLGMAISLGIALLLSAETRGMAAYRTLFYLPAIMPAVAASLLWIWIFNPQEGVLNAALAQIGITGPAWLQNELWSKPALILMTLWGAGGGMIIWLAGLKGIPRHLYEAAELDGAGPVRRFFSITLPMLSPYILFNAVMGLIGTFQIFTQAFIMTRGGPLDSTLFYAYALFNNAFRYMRMGYASAMAWVLFAIVLALTVVQLRLSKHWVYYESEK